MCRSMQLLLFYRNMLSKLESTEQSLVCVKQFSQKFIVSSTVQSETAQWDLVNHGTHGVVSDNHAYFVNSGEAEVNVTKSGRGWRISFSMSALSTERPLSPAEITCQWRSIGHQRIAHYTNGESWQSSQVVRDIEQLSQVGNDQLLLLRITCL